MKTYLPRSLSEALALKKTYAAIPLAGGTDLMIKHHSRQGLPEFSRPVLFIGHLAELQEVAATGETLSIGAACTLSAVQEHAAVPEILKQAIGSMASPAVRNRATIGGNICNASPAGDTLPVLHALGAGVVLESLDGRRETPIHAFIQGPGKTALQSDELAVAINIPLEKYNAVFYKKVGTRKADALSKLSFAGLARVSAGVVEDLRIAFGAAAPTVVRAKDIENMAIGRRAAEHTQWLPQLIMGYSALIQPIDDQRSTAQYRKTVSLNLLKHFISECLSDCVSI